MDLTIESFKDGVISHDIHRIPVDYGFRSGRLHSIMETLVISAVSNTIDATEMLYRLLTLCKHTSLMLVIRKRDKFYRLENTMHNVRLIFMDEDMSLMTYAIDNDINVLSRHGKDDPRGSIDIDSIASNSYMYIYPLIAMIPDVDIGILLYRQRPIRPRYIFNLIAIKNILATLLDGIISTMDQVPAPVMDHLSDISKLFHVVEPLHEMYQIVKSNPTLKDNTRLGVLITAAARRANNLADQYRLTKKVLVIDIQPFTRNDLLQGLQSIFSSFGTLTVQFDISIDRNHTIFLGDKKRIIQIITDIAEALIETHSDHPPGYIKTLSCHIKFKKTQPSYDSLTQLYKIQWDMHIDLSCEISSLYSPSVNDTTYALIDFMGGHYTLTYNGSTSIQHNAIHIYLDEFLRPGKIPKKIRQRIAKKRVYVMTMNEKTSQWMNQILSPWVQHVIVDDDLSLMYPKKKDCIVFVDAHSVIDIDQILIRLDEIPDDHVVIMGKRIAPYRTIQSTQHPNIPIRTLIDIVSG